MAPTLKVDGYDFSAWLQLAHEAGMDPIDSEFTEPQFSGAAAFTEGQGFVDDAIGNRVWEMPIIIKAATVDALYQAVRDINSHLFQGAQVEFKMDGAANSSYFDLERGRLDCKFEYFIARSGPLPGDAAAVVAALCPHRHDAQTSPRSSAPARCSSLPPASSATSTRSPTSS
jgi:hypothetical protein